jgi:hypothetical protein
MSPVLRKDLEYILPKLSADERQDPQKVKAAIEDFLPEHGGAYPLSEIEAALNELGRGQAR